MAEYQVLARKYRPKSFKEVLGQDAIVATLKNAIAFQRIAHAYLFSGSRGTGKTTLARIFAKALNCLNPGSDHEPCNECASCKEIAGGHSLDVLEIDGASHRGIEDIRQINETAGYAASSGHYKIYIIDEVHMLTKEAFNALLKTLEEPPPKVKFFFATTEPHKVLPTILSRCQRFHLNRLSPELIIQKLQMIAAEASVKTDEDALRIIANMADGGLRDAESLFDQVLAFHQGDVTAANVASILGVVSNDTYFELDLAGKEGNLAKAFEIADRIFAAGKDVIHFVEGLVEHFRNLLLVKLSGAHSSFLSLSAVQRERYEASAKIYSQEQCLTILDFLLEDQQRIRFTSSLRIALEAILMRIIRIHHRVPIDIIVKKLAELEQLAAAGGKALPAVAQTPEVPPPAPIRVEKTQELFSAQPLIPPKIEPKKIVIKEEPVFEPVVKPSLTEDPTPAAQELPRGAPQFSAKVENRVEDVKTQSRYDTIFQFAAVELEGTINKKNLKQ